MTRSLALLGCGVLLILPGCYSRVVGASGLGAVKYTIEPSARSNTAADRAVDSWWKPGAQAASPTTRKSRWSGDIVDPAATPRRRTPSLGATQRAGVRTSTPGAQAPNDAPSPTPPTPPTQADPVSKPDR
jgi:hypothetical protein